MDGILTEREREFLKSDGSGYTDQNKRDYYRAIKLRVHNAILDFAILFDHWPEEERNEVFQDLMDETGSIDGLADVFAFLYSAAHVSGAFEEALKQGVRKAEYRQSSLELPNHAVRTKFEVERFPKAGLSAVQKYRKGPEGIAELTEEEARLLLDALYVDDTLGDDSVAHAELRFQKFLDGEPPDELKEKIQEQKTEVHDEMKQDREQRAEYYTQRNRQSEDHSEKNSDT